MTPLADQIACVKREIALRERLYPRWIVGGRLRRADAEREIATMKAVLETLADLQRCGVV